ncbi:FAD-dependent monooxygenase [Cesiribacter sp. SM1]|uniref:FAD-dependent monooxygenase n=1 Tax=Cesiribacter sp. SM1 TaxID=2861196 RepID=UPI001CD5E56B|nr:FAD-dependent monooxygenase [Cesiribacter sp. SM1]
MNKETKIGIIGGGIGGLTLALTLEHFGFSNYRIFEQAPAFKEIGAALSVWPNALRVYRKIGVYEQLIPYWGEIEAAYIKTSSGRVLSQVKPQYDLPAVCMHRADLHAVLLKNVPPDRLFPAHPLAEFRQEEKGAVVVNFEQQEQQTFDLLLGADGIHSRVRQQIIGDGTPIYRGYNIWRGVAALDVPQGYGSETWGRGARVGIVPIKGNSFGWWATLNEQEAESDEPEGTLRKLKRLFGGWHYPIPHLFDNSQNIIKNPLGDRLPRKGWSRGRVTLLGDAAHPTTPNLGQGACMAIEGAYLLSHCLHHYSAYEQAFAQYEKLHYPRTKEVIEQSLLNGRMGQLEHPLLVALRNGAVSLMPDKLSAKMLDKYFSYDVTAVEV